MDVHKTDWEYIALKTCNTYMTFLYKLAKTNLKDIHLICLKSAEKNEKENY